MVEAAPANVRASRALVVDDDASVRDVVRRYLQAPSPLWWVEAILSAGSLLGCLVRRQAHQ